METCAKFILINYVMYYEYDVHTYNLETSAKLILINQTMHYQ